MAGKDSVKRLTKVDAIGTFRHPESLADHKDFARYNLIYGLNGSGKTTISRILRSLETGDPLTNNEGGGIYQIEMSSGASIGNPEGGIIKQDNILTFNVDFIEQNFSWKQGTASPVFYIGKSQAALAREVAKLEAHIANISNDIRVSEALFTTADQGFAVVKREIARGISESLNLGRKYEAPHLTADYSSGKYATYGQLQQGRYTELRESIRQTAPLPTISPFEDVLIELHPFTQGVISTLSKTVSTTLQEAIDHPSMMNWLKEGSEYHQNNHLNVCLHCGNPITNERIALLCKGIDDSFDRLLNESLNLKAKAEALSDQLDQALSQTPSVNDISQELRSEYIQAEKRFRITLTNAKRVVVSLIPYLTKKASRPNQPISAQDSLAGIDLQAVDSAAASAVFEMNSIIQRHNIAHAKFHELQVSARELVKGHHLARDKMAYERAQNQRDNAEARVKSLTQELEKSRLQAEDSKRQMRQYRPAADVINSLVSSYLGRKELELRPVDEGYSILRNGTLVVGSLSEGEKTAIALCHFISTLQAEGRKVSDLVVIVDDPISSLDTNALNYAASLIKSSLGNAKQLFVLTHNLQFMNEMKKWLRNKYEKEEAKFLYLDIFQSANEKRCHLIELPRLLRDYESEYHYLFDTALKFSRDPNAYDHHLYLIPNALRKVLDVFLAFKVPGAAGLASKVEAITHDPWNIDENRARALDRLVQVESHADSLDDLIAFSSLTIEETIGAARALIEMIATVDPEHSRRMIKICTKAA